MCSPWKDNKDESRVFCEKRTAHCAVKRDFKTRMSQITIKVGDTLSFLMGFHVYEKNSDTDIRAQNHRKMPINFRVLDHSNFKAAHTLSATAIILVSCIITHFI